MTIKTSTLALTCPKCGGDQFIQPDNPDLQSNVTCAGCGAVFVAGALLDPQAVADEAQRLALDVARPIFGKAIK